MQHQDEVVLCDEHCGCSGLGAVGGRSLAVQEGANQGQLLRLSSSQWSMLLPSPAPEREHWYRELPWLVPLLCTS